MSIYTDLQEKLTEARRNGDSRVLGNIQYIIGEVGRQRKVDVTDKAVSAVVKTVHKRLTQAQAESTCPDVQANYQEDIDVVAYFLPKQMSETELNHVIDQAIETGASNIGQVMGKLKSIGVDFDGRIASQLIKLKLA